MVVRFVEAGADTKDCPGLSSFPLRKTCSLVFVKPRGKARVQKFCAIGSFHARLSPVQPLSPWG